MFRIFLFALMLDFVDPIVVCDTPHDARTIRDAGRGLSMVNVQPKLDRSHGAHPLVGAFGHASAMLMSGKLTEGSQGGSFGFSNRSGRVQRRLLGRQPLHQCPRFLIGADCGNLQDRFAVTGFDKALLVAR
ncbi:hypothetical protein AB8A28_19760 [Tardiphaga sp. 71_E8_N1_1]|uniref:hypothetical protein n=1 Tax=Tardiphaga sp. 71_E8_N1_1 TaxID=3240784 RepID=UPI000FF5495C